MEAIALRARWRLEIAVSGEAPGEVVPPIGDFQEVEGALPRYAVDALRRLGMVRPLPIQAQVLPFALRGNDLIGIAQTGSGKSLAFLLPAIAHVEATDSEFVEGIATPKALILAPVRELASQIAEQANQLLPKSTSRRHPAGIGAACIYGGGARVRDQQVKEIKGYHDLLVATPGRLCDFIEDQVSLAQVGYLVLDEADRLLDDGFGEQVAGFDKHMRRQRQTLFFSATWPQEIQALASQLCRGSLVRVAAGQQLGGEGPRARSDVVQEVVVLDEGDWHRSAAVKRKHLNRHLRNLLQYEENKVLVFVDTRATTWELGEQLQKEGFKADYMYGGRSQDARQAIVDRFKTGEIKLLVTTDVMARGLDIPGISHVVVYDSYGGIEEYVHRIGRTARGLSGRGNALTFFEFSSSYPSMPAELIAVLEAADQAVPAELRKIAEEVASGERPGKVRRKG